MEEEKYNELDETEVAPIDKKSESIHFPWGIAIVMAVLAALIIACFIVVMVLGPVDMLSSSSQISGSSL